MRAQRMTAQEELEHDMHFRAERVEKQFCKGFGQHYGEDLAFSVSYAYLNECPRAIRIIEELNLGKIDCIAMIGDIKWYGDALEQEMRDNYIPDIDD